jgi:hypothetical protein
LVDCFTDFALLFQTAAALRETTNSKDGLIAIGKLMMTLFDDLVIVVCF